MSLLIDNTKGKFNPEEDVKFLLKTHFPYHLECPGPGQPEPELVGECLDLGAVGLDRKLDWRCYPQHMDTKILNLLGENKP